MFNGLNPMDKLAHAYQLLDIWHRAGQVYRRLWSAPPQEAVHACACLAGSRAAILEQLTKMATAIRREPGRKCK